MMRRSARKIRNPQSAIRNPGERRRPRNRRRPDWLRAVLALLLLAVGGECLWAAFTSPRLAIRRIEVVGAKTLSAEEVAALTGIQVGGNIFRANLYRARKAVRALPPVREVNVGRLLPDTIAVILEERQPLFTLVAGARRYEIDRDGVIFRELTAPSRTLGAGRIGASTRTLLSVPAAASLGLGQKLDRSVVNSALHCVKLARADGLKLWKITIDAQGDLWLNIRVSGPMRPMGPSWRIRMGRPQQLSAKFADARQIMRSAPQLAATAEYLDVSCPRRPAYRVATAGARASDSAAPLETPAVGTMGTGPRAVGRAD